MTSDTLALEAIKIGKRFGAVHALTDVSLRLRTGSVHALLGENGAGKSTLVKCIMGYYRPDSGQVLVRDREHALDDPRSAVDAGIGMVYQHFTLIPNMTVMENLVLARPRLPAVIDWRAERKALTARMDTMPFPIALDAQVNRLAAGEKQKLEIVKQLLLDCRILILDEPTSVLTPNEADEVLGRVRELALQNQLSVLLITHKFREVLTYTDEVTVLRKGCNAGGATRAEIDEAKLAEMMLGASFAAKTLQRGAVASTQASLKIRDLHVDNDSGLPAVRALSLSVHSGEIVGIAGVSGNGQRELVEALAGQRLPTRGEILLHEQNYRGGREQMNRHRFRCLPEEPLTNACVGGMSVAENLAFRVFDRPPFARLGWLRRRHFNDAARQLIGEFKIRTAGPDALLGQLSGGNVQRTVLARELGAEVEVLVAANPCFGLDFAAVAEVHARIMAARNRGAAVLLLSEDLDEILTLSDRVCVISGGTLVYETTPARANPAVLGRYMAGHHGDPETPAAKAHAAH